jgi:hypothetical protein
MLLEELTCVGRETAVVLSCEAFWRDFRDRRGPGAFANGLDYNSTLRPGRLSLLLLLECHQSEQFE